MLVDLVVVVVVVPAAAAAIVVVVVVALAPILSLLCVFLNLSFLCNIHNEVDCCSSVLIWELYTYSDKTGR